MLIRNCYKARSFFIFCRKSLTNKHYLVCKFVEQICWWSNQKSKTNKKSQSIVRNLPKEVSHFQAAIVEATYWTLKSENLDFKNTHPKKHTFYKSHLYFMKLHLYSIKKKRLTHSKLDRHPQNWYFLVKKTNGNTYIESSENEGKPQRKESKLEDRMGEQHRPPCVIYYSIASLFPPNLVSKNTSYLKSKMHDKTYVIFSLATSV